MMSCSQGWTWQVEAKINMNWFLFHPRQLQSLIQICNSLFWQSNQFPMEWFLRFFSSRIFCFIHKYVTLCGSFMASDYNSSDFVCECVVMHYYSHLLCPRNMQAESSDVYTTNTKRQSRSQCHEEICISFGFCAYFIN